jgi:hypothetical protein
MLAKRTAYGLKSAGRARSGSGYSSTLALRRDSPRFARIHSKLLQPAVQRWAGPIDLIASIRGSFAEPHSPGSRNSVPISRNTCAEGFDAALPKRQPVRYHIREEADAEAEI